MSELCYCGSFRGLEVCHGALASDIFELPKVVLMLQIPEGLAKEESQRIAEGSSALGSYDVQVNDKDRVWELRLRGGGPYLELLPLARGDHEVLPERSQPQRVEVDQLLPESVPPTSQAARAAGLIALALSPKPTGIDGIHAFKDRVANLLAIGTLEELAEVSRSVVDVLRSQMPHVCVDYLAIDARLLNDCVLVRSLARLKLLTTEQILAQLSSGGPEGAINFVLDPERHFQLLSNLGYPDAHGFSNPYLLGRAYIDYGEDVLIEPVDWSERRARDIGASIMTVMSGSTKIRGLNPDVTSRRFLRVWLTRRLNRLFMQLLYLGSFRSSDQQFVDPVHQWQDLLTVQDILDLTGTLFTTSDPVVMKMLFFDLMDRYTALGGTQIEDLLQRKFIEKACASLGEELGDLRDPVRGFILRAWSDTEAGLWEGIYDETTRRSGKVSVTNGKGGVDVLEPGQFARRMLGVLRNTTHGYRLEREEFERLLVHHNGVMPDRVRELAIGLWFALLSDPSLFWKGRARFDTLKIAP